MWDLEPGPIEREDLPLGPNVFTPARLARHLDLLVGELGTSDAAFAAQQTLIAGNTADGLDALFASTIGAAADLDADHPSADDDPTAAVLVDAGAGTEAYRQSVLRFLPNPEFPVPDDYLPPPPNPNDFPIDYTPPDVPGNFPLD